MSTIRVNAIQSTSTTDGGISIDNSGHVSIEGQSLPSAGPLSNRNLIINGAMLVDQRNAGSSYTITGDAQYTLDRWVARTYAGTGRFSVQQDGSSPDNINPSAKLTVTTTDTPGTYGYAFSQRVEGYNFSSLAYGSSSAKAATISFWVRSSITGTYCFSVRNSAADRSYVAEYSISSANTWEYKTITIPGATDGTWLTTNGVGAYLEWNLGAQTSKETTAGSWQSGNYHATSNQADWIATSGATFYLTGVQLEVGSVATPFEHRSYGDELKRCERYYQMFTAGIDDRTIAMGAFYNTTFIGCALPFRTTMRSSPTIDASSGGNYFTFYIHGIAHGTQTVTAGGGTTPYAAGIRPSSAVSGTQGSAGEFKASNTAAHLAFSAEL